MLEGAKQAIDGVRERRTGGERGQAEFWMASYSADSPQVDRRATPWAAPRGGSLPQSPSQTDPPRHEPRSSVEPAAIVLARAECYELERAICKSSSESRDPGRTAEVSRDQICRRPTVGWNWPEPTRSDVDMLNWHSCGNKMFRESARRVEGVSHVDAGADYQH